MQTNWQGNMRNSFSALPYSPKAIFRLFIFFAFIFLSTPSRSQEVLQKIRDATKKFNITVGSPIENDTTKKVLEVLDRRIAPLIFVINRYNQKFGNDSVRAMRFVDKEPDEKSDDPIVKNYYGVVVVSDSAHQVARWFSFLVRKDLEEVKYYDLKNAKTGDIDEWKKIWPASEFLK
jgi:hypothetical protein